MHQPGCVLPDPGRHYLREKAAGNTSFTRLIIGRNRTVLCLIEARPGGRKRQPQPAGFSTFRVSDTSRSTTPFSASASVHPDSRMSS